MISSRRTVSKAQVVAALSEAGLAGSSLVVHASLRSFGTLEAGPDTIIDAILAVGSTILVPTHSFRSCLIAPPEKHAIDFNSEDDGSLELARSIDVRPWETGALFVDPAMGHLPSRVLERTGHVRGDHPLCSFTALGPLARDLVAHQTAIDVFAPLRELALRGGQVVAMGVDLSSVTLIHLAEQQAGLRMLQRWALSNDGPITCLHGGCSRGFERLATIVRPVETQARVGLSPWRIWPAASMLGLLRDQLRLSPGLGTCSNDPCPRCRDLVAEALTTLSHEGTARR